jgi:hypothetical protein
MFAEAKVIAAEAVVAVPVAEAVIETEENPNLARALAE